MGRKRIKTHGVKVATSHNYEVARVFLAKNTQKTEKKPLFKPMPEDKEANIVVKFRIFDKVLTMTKKEQERLYPGVILL